MLNLIAAHSRILRKLGAGIHAGLAREPSRRVAALSRGNAYALPCLPCVIRRDVLSRLDLRGIAPVVSCRLGAALGLMSASVSRRLFATPHARPMDSGAIVLNRSGV